MESKHMQTPWETTNNMFGVGNMRVWGIIQKDKDIERPVANCGTDGKTDAEFIVTACNAHDDLVAALEATTAAAERFESLLITQWDMKPTKELTAAIASGLTALAKAKGEQS